MKIICGDFVENKNDDDFYFVWNFANSHIELYLLSANRKKLKLYVLNLYIKSAVTAPINLILQACVESSTLIVIISS